MFCNLLIISFLKLFLIKILTKEIKSITFLKEKLVINDNLCYKFEISFLTTRCFREYVSTLADVSTVSNSYSALC